MQKEEKKKCKTSGDTLTRHRPVAVGFQMGRCVQMSTMLLKCRDKEAKMRSKTPGYEMPFSINNAMDPFAVTIGRNIVRKSFGSPNLSRKPCGEWSPGALYSECLKKRYCCDAHDQRQWGSLQELGCADRRRKSGHG